MKNFKKLLCLILTVLICFSLVGCNAIDEMRSAQIYFNENKNLVYNEQEYKLLPECTVFTPDTTYNKNLYITEKDVPVLLAEMFGDSAYLTDDNRFICLSDDDEYDSEYSVYTKYYARADIYDSIAERIESGNYFEGFCFYYEKYDGDSDDMWQTNHQIISEKAEAAVKDIVTNCAPAEIDIDLLNQFTVTDLFACSSDLLFKEYYATIYKTEQYIYLTTTLNNRFESEVAFVVPEEHTELFESLINGYYEAEVTFDEWWAENEE